MTAEYVKLSRQEVLYGQKNFLKAQLDVLDLVKHYTRYQEARKQELLMKIELKTRLDEAKSNIILLERMMPRVYSPESDAKKKIMLEKNSKQTSSLQQEIDLIKQKLASLQEE